MKLKSLLLGLALAPAGSAAQAQQTVALKFHTFMAPQSKGVAHHACGVNGKGRKG